MPLFFALTLFLNSTLLFLVQPMVAKMVLPQLGGTPAVWNTCMVFFQALLLAGYAYAHALPARLGVRRHAILHVLLFALPLLLLPIALGSGWENTLQAHPILGLLTLLFVSVGLPVFVIATTAPLLQQWFAHTGHADARDPYFLYAASNFGSMLALFSYPFLVERLLSLPAQSRWWAAGYGLLTFLVAGCAVVLWRRRQADKAASVTLARKERESGREPSPPSWAMRGRWVLLAFVPSSLMLSVTTYLTTDIAAIPLLWLVPLALYLLTFILVFARRPPLSHALLARCMPLVVLVLALALLSEATKPMSVLIVLHLLGLFVVAMVCHGELARTRPAPRYLTAFYLWMSVGGVLGGLFNALIAPLVFSSVAEYPLVLVLACFLRPAPAASPDRASGQQPAPTGFEKADVLVPIALGVVTAALVLGVRAWGLGPGPLSLGIMFGVPTIVCYTFLERPPRFGFGIAALLLAGILNPGVYGVTSYRERSFFGVHRVTLDPTGTFRLLVHGNTVHGQESLSPAHRGEPLTYYHRTGPIGRVFKSLEGDPRLKHVAVIGLGAGSLAAYAEPGQHWTYYEIDPSVVHIARDSGYFSFLGSCRADLDITLGDARLTLARSDQRYGLIVVDAFSSDAIPLHLLTKEAFRVYREHLTEDGILAFNISNRYLDLQPVLGDLAARADPPLVCHVREDLSPSDQEKQEGKAPSIWVVMGHRAKDLRPIVRHGMWLPVQGRPGAQAWTDDFANLLDVLKWE